MVHAGDDLPASAYAEVLAEVPALEGPVLALAGGETPGRGGVGGGVHPRGPAPHQAPQQGGGRGQGHLPGPGMTARRPRAAAGPGPCMTRRWDYRRWDGSQTGFEDEVDALFSRARRRPPLPRRPRRGPASPAHLGLPSAPTASRSRACASSWSACANGARRSSTAATSAGPSTRSPRSSTTWWPRSAPGSQALAEDARQSGDERRQEVTDDVVAERSIELELLPPDLAGRVRGLQNYDFVSSEAREHFEELLEKLREEIAKSFFDQMSEAMTNPDPEQIERVRQMLDALNRMMEQRQAGEDLDPSFESFMESIRGLLPRQPPDPRRAPRAVRGADGGGAGRPRLHVARAAGPAPGPGGVAVKQCIASVARFDVRSCSDSNRRQSGYCKAGIVPSPEHAYIRLSKTVECHRRVAGVEGVAESSFASAIVDHSVARDCR